MDKEKELLSKEELALMRGGFGIEDVTVYALGVQGVNNCCNTSNNGGTDTCNSCKLHSFCSMRNCRIKSYSQKLGLFAKPDNCLIDKVE